jgi:CBS domain-containing protein
MRPAPKISEHDTLEKTARLMIESGIRQLPVFSGEKMLGFITNEQVIHSLVLEKMGETKIKEIMTKKLVTVNEDDSIGHVLSLFREHNVSHAPVVSEGKLVGIISILDIITNVFQPRQRQTEGEIVGEKIAVLSTPAKGLMSKPVITMLPENEVKDAVEKMHHFNISSLIIIKEKRPIGIVTKRDLLESIVQMEQADRRLTIQFSIKDVEIDEIQQNFLINDFKSFSNRFQEMLEAGTLFVYMKTYGTNFKGDQSIHCRLHLRTRKGSFFSSDEGYGVEQIFQKALDKLEKQILRDKKFEHNSEFVRTYLRQIQFPLSDL